MRICTWDSIFGTPHGMTGSYATTPDGATHLWRGGQSGGLEPPTSWVRSAATMRPQDRPAAPGRVQNGYLSSGRARASTARVEELLVSSENAPARARAWTRVPHSSFPRNEGVRGSNPRVGFFAICRDFFCEGNWQRAPSGTKRVGAGTTSHAVTGSLWVRKFACKSGSSANRDFVHPTGCQ